MIKTIDEQLQEALERRDKFNKEKDLLIQKIRKNDESIKALRRKKKQENDEAVIKKIEAAGFSVEDVLQLMSEKLSDDKKKGEE